MVYRISPKGRALQRAGIAAQQFNSLTGELHPDMERLAQTVPPKRAKRARTVADGPSEHQEQSAVIDWWRRACASYGLPEFALFAIPNGGGRSMVQAVMLKREGVRPGVSDLFLAARAGFRDVPGKRGLFIEMKVKPNKASDAQIEFGEYVASAGYGSWVCYSADQAIAAIKQYLA
jgi:hypothetical protein